MMKNKLNITSIIFALVWLFVVVRSQSNPIREVICKANEWKCANKRQCIPNNYLCDKYDDCIDASDEQNCDIVCSANEWRCSDKRQCIPKNYLCDKYEDCTDKSDEQNCATTTKRTTRKSTTRIFTTPQKPITGPTGSRKCGQPAIQPILTNSRMIGGIPARPHSWPWHIYLEYPEDPSVNGCGGTIINETTVITAAHCLKFNTSWTSRFIVAAGSHNLLSSTDGPYQRRNVKKIFIPDELQMPHDIAILILSKPFVFDDRVSAICLPKTQVTNEQNCYVSGYGATYGQLPETTLNQARTPIADWQQCKDIGYDGLTEFDVCAGYFNGNVDTCPGDSGGPLTCLMNDSRWYLNGITSRGGNCEDPKWPGVYVNVYKYIDWIVAKTGFKFE